MTFSGPQCNGAAHVFLVLDRIVLYYSNKHARRHSWTTGLKKILTFYRCIYIVCVQIAKDSGKTARMCSLV